LVPGVSKKNPEATVRYLAKRHKTTYKNELKATIASISKQVSRNTAKRNEAIYRGLQVMGSGGSNVPIRQARKAKAAGDIFVSTSGFNSSGTNFGHTGVYRTTKSIVHAPGAGKVAVQQSIDEVSVGVGTEYMKVTKLKAKTRKAVAKYAYRTYLGQGYNYMFFANKLHDGMKVTVSFGGVVDLAVTLNPADRVNCSELVWASYKKKAKVDLDGYPKNEKGDAAAFPWDIAASDRTKTYAVQL